MKKTLAVQFPHDITRYIDGRTDLLLRILTAMELPPSQLATLECANRAHSREVG